MKVLQAFKWQIVLFILGFIALQIGALVKIRHWPGGDAIITVSYGIIVVSLFLVLVKVMRLKKDVKN